MLTEQKEWYEESLGKLSYEIEKCQLSGCSAEYRIVYLIEEAMRRGREEAWEEARELVEQDLNATRGLMKIEPRIHGEYLSGLFQAYRLINRELCKLQKKT